MESPLLIAVVGPTGAGKSDLALAIAEKFDGEIVNCDSIQLYRYMDIGSAKTPLAQRRGIPHHLIDILDPDDHFTAGDYAREARRVAREIADRGRVPVLVGGTGFYFSAFLHGLSESPARDVALRERLARRSPAAAHRLLKRFDPIAAARIHPNDVHKVIRALEVCLLTRKPMSEHFEQNTVRPLEGFHVAKIGLAPSRELLAERIHARTIAMFNAGLVEETARVLSMGYSPGSKALQSIGYREAVEHLERRITLAEAIEHTTIATRQYAKRQRTWFRREPNIAWFSGFGDNELIIETAIHHLHVGVEFR